MACSWASESSEYHLLNGITKQVLMYVRWHDIARKLLVTFGQHRQYQPPAASVN